MTSKATEVKFTDDHETEWQHSVEVIIKRDDYVGSALMVAGVRDCDISYAEECGAHGLITAWALGDDWIDFDARALAVEEMDDLLEVAVNAATAFYRKNK